MKLTQLMLSVIEKWGSLFTVIIFSTAYTTLHAGEVDNAFRFELTPYLWAASINGTTAAGGEASPPIDSGYDFFSLDNLDGVASAAFTAHKNQWGVLFDFLYVAYEDTFFESTILETKPRLEGTIIEFAGTYSPSASDHLEIVAGFRQQDITVSLAYLNRKPEQSATWTDPFAGIIYSRPLNGNFHISLRGDMGGFGINSDRAVNAEAMFRYQLSKTFAVKFGYRYLKVKFDDKDFIYDIGLEGFQLGLGVRF